MRSPVADRYFTAHSSQNADAQHGSDYLKKSSIVLCLIIKDYSGHCLMLFDYDFAKAVQMRAIAKNKSVAQEITCAQCILAVTGIVALGISALLLYNGMSIFFSLSFSLLIFLSIYLLVNHMLVNSDALINELNINDMDIVSRLAFGFIDESTSQFKKWSKNL